MPKPRSALHWIKIQSHTLMHHTAYQNVILKRPLKEIFIKKICLEMLLECSNATSMSQFFR